MARPKFPAAKYIKDVLRSQSPESSVTQSPNYQFTRDEEKEVVIAVINQLRAKGIDITANYDNWIRTAAAFSSAFGEEGSVYFHSVCQNYPAYNVEECDELYSRIMKTNKNVVTLGTFYHLCTEHGVDVKAIYKDFGAKKKSKAPEMPKVPQMPQNHYAENVESEDVEIEDCLMPFTKKREKQLPEFLRSILCMATSEEEKDMMLLSAITIIASVLGKKVVGMYDNNSIYATMFLIIVGKAGSRKGIIASMRNLVKPIHEYQRTIYKQQKDDYLATKAKSKNGDCIEIDKPKNRMHLIPADSSAAAFFQALETMKGVGLILDTEIDTLVQVFKQDWGNFSKILRKTFHHESDEIYRKTNDEYYNVEEPAECVLLTGTKEQFRNLIPNVENGLFSRFLFFHKKAEFGWKNIKNDEGGMDKRTFFYNLGQRLFKFYKELEALEEPVKFDLTKSQWNKFNKTFAELYDTLVTIEGEDIHASVARFGTITYRIMMVLTMLRVMTSGMVIPEKVYCSDVDFQTAIHITKSAMPHMAKFFNMLEPVKKVPEKKVLILNREDITKLYKALPKHFTTKEFLNIASEKFHIPKDTATKWLKALSEPLFIIREKQGHYRKEKKI